MPVAVARPNHPMRGNPRGAQLADGFELCGRLLPGEPLERPRGSSWRSGVSPRSSTMSASGPVTRSSRFS